MNAPGPLRRAWSLPGVRFAFVGGFTAGLNLLGLWWMVDGLGVPWPVAVTALFFALNFVGYVMNKRVTFRLGAAVATPELRRYYVVMALSLAANLGLMTLLVEGLHLAYLLASVVVTVLLAAVNFLAHRDVTFDAAARAAARAAGAPLHVLQVSAFFAAHGGGIEVVAGELAHRLAARGARVTWMAGGRRDERPIAGQVVIDQAASVDFLERRLGLPAPVWNLSSLRRLWRHVGAADIVHVHDYLYLPSLAAIAFARLRRRAVLLTQHVGDIPFESRAARRVLRGLNRSLGRWVLGRADQVAFVGRPVMQTFEAFVHWRRPPRLVPNGVDHARWHPRTNDLPDRGAPALRVLFVGRFVEKKGVALLRHCLDIDGVHWTFVGRGPLPPVGDDEHGPDIELLGALAPDAVADQMRAADVLVLPSKGEGFPLVVQEALACGTPVLVSREVAEAFPRTDARCVWDVDLEPGAAGDASAPVARLRSALEGLRDDRDRARAARPWAAALAAQWSWDRCVEEYEFLYRRIVH